MEIVLVIGDSNQGKSSLVRCLTGKSRDLHDHPNPKNVLLLDWNQPGSTENTLTLISSLNEGTKYPNTGVQSYRSPIGTGAIHPLDLGDMLDDYLQLLSDNEQKVATKAILCVSNSVPTIGWQAIDYFNVLTNPNPQNRLIQHAIIHTVLIGHQRVNLNWPNQTIVPGRGTPVNTVADQARTQIPIV